MKATQLHKEIGTSKDNRKSPIHDWYRFTAGFSYKLIDKVIAEEKLTSKSTIYESFAGCGTTLVSAQKNGINAIGNEGQELLFDVIQAKLNWNINTEEVHSVISEISSKLKGRKKNKKYHKLLKTLYSSKDLYELYSVRDIILDKGITKETSLFLKLALTQTLHKVSIHPIAVPYISRSKVLSNDLTAFNTFEATANKMLLDLETFGKKEKTAQIYLHDSRTENTNIDANSCSICITSPPYLNNLDYGEVSKVCSHFYGITDTFQEVTEKVRKKLVTGATTHYKDQEFDLEVWKQKEFYSNNTKIVDKLMPSIEKIKSEGKLRAGKKSFDILALYYFEDMYHVLVEMKRVLKENSKAYLVLGDSAPYGIYIDTIRILGEIAKSVGFKKYKIVKIRERGTKWKTLRFRHNLKLSESILILE